MRGARGVVAGISVVGVALAAIVALRWSPEVPDGAASVALARTELTGSIAPDAADGQDPAEIPRSPAGGECLPRIQDDAGYLDACWQAHRSPADSDPTKDYYLLNVYGTFGPGPGGSPRWAVLRAELEGSPADGVFEGWPVREIGGTCESVAVTLPLVEAGTEEMLCDPVTGSAVEPWGYRVTWTCRGCLLPDDRDRALNLHVMVGVDAGSVPAWRIFADVGS